MNGKPYCLIRSAMTSEFQPRPAFVSVLEAASRGCLSMGSLLAERSQKKAADAGAAAAAEWSELFLLHHVFQERDEFRGGLHRRGNRIGHRLAGQRLDRQLQGL